MGKIIDITGQKFGKLTVLDWVGAGKWSCQCECGYLTLVQPDNLRNGNTKSCGCLQRERASEVNFKSLVGKRFGKLVVLERVKNDRFNHVNYRCKCDCGGEVIVDASNLRQGNTNSCGCVKSKGEMIINNWLQEHNIPFQSQYSIDEIVLDSGRRPFIDLAIFDNNNILLCLIEYNGKQHYEITGGWNNKEMFEITQYRDKQKSEWCKKLNIPLYTISYLDDIDKEMKKIKNELDKNSTNTESIKLFKQNSF